MAIPGTLYVFLHGLSVVRQRGSKLEIVLPRVPGHVYKAGAWLGETEITRRSVLHLRGVTPGTKSFADAHFTIDLPDCSLTSEGRAATLWLPKADLILRLRRATVPTTPFPTPPPVPPRGRFVVWRNDKVNIGWESVATSIVLRYDYIDEDQVVLDGHHSWEPAAVGGAMSLHIISTSENVETEQHTLDTAEALRRVIRGYPGVTFAIPVIPPDWRDVNNPNYGDLGDLEPQGEYIVRRRGGSLAFAQAELEDFRPRMTRLMRLGRLKQEKRPIEGLWRSPDPLGEETSNCVIYTVK